ncbi:MAG: HAD family hydrolase [bacterium]|nr:HAD family hydrolase [bacterium]
MTNQKQKIIVFDLDGTLIQSDQFVPIPDWDFSINRYWDETPGTVTVKVRPNVESILRQLSNYYFLALFTHSFPLYIAEVLKKSNLDEYFEAVFSNHDEINGGKDLTVVLDHFGFDPEKDLKQIIIIDDHSWCNQENNVLLVNSYQGGEDSLYNKSFIKKIENKFKTL